MVEITDKELESLDRLSRLEYQMDKEKYNYSLIFIDYIWKLMLPVSLFCLIVMAAKLEVLMSVARQLTILAMIVVGVAFIADIIFAIYGNYKIDELNKKYFDVNIKVKKRRWKHK